MVLCQTSDIQSPPDPNYETGTKTRFVSKYVLQHVYTESIRNMDKLRSGILCANPKFHVSSAYVGKLNPYQMDPNSSLPLGDYCSLKT